MRDFAVVMILTASLIWALVVCETSKNTYLVKLFFCDSRPPRIIRVKCFSPPHSCDITNGGGNRLAVPEYEGYLNVCEITTLSEVK